MATRAEVIDALLDRMKSPNLKPGEFDDLHAQVLILEGEL